MDQNEKSMTFREKTMNRIQDTLNELLVDKFFKIEQVSYHEEHFGNIIIILTSKENVKIRFTRDRMQYFSCEIGSSHLPDKWFFLEDILKIIGAKPSPSFTNFFEMMSFTLKLIREYWTSISDALNETNFSETLLKLENIKIERGKEYDKRRIELQSSRKNPWQL